jgi:hypothetical protein
MLLKLLKDRRFFQVLLGMDRELADAARAAGCGCGGALHRSDFARKPRGGPDGLDDWLEVRFSLCCARDGCRRRLTPQSVRFLGRKVYYGAMVLVASVMVHGASRRRVLEVGRELGVSERTLLRWRRWWTEVFASSRFWSVARARFSPAVVEVALPGSLEQRFAGDEITRLVRTLEFLRPVTTGSGFSGAAF